MRRRSGSFVVKRQVTCTSSAMALVLCGFSVRAARLPSPSDGGAPSGPDAGPELTARK